MGVPKELGELGAVAQQPATSNHHNNPVVSCRANQSGTWWAVVHTLDMVPRKDLSCEEFEPHQPSKPSKVVFKDICESKSRCELVGGQQFVGLRHANECNLVEKIENPNKQYSTNCSWGCAGTSDGVLG